MGTVICETTNDLQGYLSTSAMKRIEQKHQPSSAFNHLRASRQAFRIEDMVSVISDKVKDLEDRMSTSATQQIDEKNQSPGFPIKEQTTIPRYVGSERFGTNAQTAIPRCVGPER